jgi:hypothetical protein
MTKNIKPIAGSEKLFKISQKRIVTGTSTKNKSGKTFSLIEDIDSTKDSFDKIIQSIPTQPGIIILTGHYKTSMRPWKLLRQTKVFAPNLLATYQIIVYKLYLIT